MSFNKYTLNLSRVDVISHYLREKKCEFTIKNLDKIDGRGINDLIPYKEQKRVYSIRKLQYLDKVLLERMIRTKDIEIDDYFISQEFDEDKLPKDWITIMHK